MHLCVLQTSAAQIWWWFCVWCQNVDLGRKRFLSYDTTRQGTTQAWQGGFWMLNKNYVCKWFVDNKIYTSDKRGSGSLPEFVRSGITYHQHEQEDDYRLRVVLSCGINISNIYFPESLWFTLKLTSSTSIMLLLYVNSNCINFHVITWSTK